MEDDIQNLDSFNFNIVVNKKSKTTSNKDNMSQRATKQKKKESKQTPKMSTIIEENTEPVHEGNAAIMIEKNTENNKIEITPDNAANAETPLLRRKRKLYSPKHVKFIEEVPLKSQENDFLDSKVNKTPKSVHSYKPYKDLERERKKYIRMPQISKSKLIPSQSPRSNKNNGLFDKEYYEKLKLANKGDEFHNSSTDSEDFKQKIEISKRNSTTTSGAEEGTMVLSRGREVKRVNYVYNNSNITIRQRTKKKLADIKPANELIDERMIKKNEVLDISVVVDVPQKVEGETELVLENKLQMETITAKAEKSNKKQQKGKITKKNKAKTVDLIKAAKKPVVNKNTIDNDRTESPLTDLVVEETLTKNKEDGDLSTNMVDKFKKLCRNPEIYINESNTTQNLLSDHVPLKSQENDFLDSKVNKTPKSVPSYKPYKDLERKRKKYIHMPQNSKAKLTQPQSPRSKKNYGLFDKEYYEKVKLANKGDEFYNSSTDSEDCKQKIEISKRNSTTTSGAEEGTMVLRRGRVFKRVIYSGKKESNNNNSNITIRQRTKKRLADIKPANDLIDQRIREKNEVLDISAVVDVPQMVEGEPELVLEKNLQMEPITDKAENSNKNQQEGKITKAKTVDLIKAAEEPVVIKNTIDNDRTESPLTDLVVEETLTKNKEDGDLSTNMVDKFKKLCRNPEKYINESNTTQNLLSDHVPLKSQENDFLDSKVNKTPKSVPSYKPYKDLERKRKKYIHMPQNSKAKLTQPQSPRSKKNYGLFDKEYYEKVKLANKGDEFYNSSTDSEDCKQKIEISKRNSTTTSGAEEGTMVLRRGRVFKRVIYSGKKESNNNNSNITIRQRTKKRLADIKPANDLIDQRIREKNEVLDICAVVDVPQMVEGEPELVLEKNLQMEPITDKAENSNKNQQEGKITKAKTVDLIKAAEEPVVIKNTIDNDRTESPLPDLVVEETLTKNKEDGNLSTNMVDKFKNNNDLFDKIKESANYEQVRLANKGDEVNNISTDSEDFQQKIEISKRNSTTTSGAEEGTMVLSPGRVVQRVNYIYDNSNVTIRQRTKKRLAVMKPANEFIDQRIREKNEVLDTSPVVDVPQMVEGEPELVLENKLQMETITETAEKSNKNQQKGKMSKKNKAKTVDLIKAAEKPIVIKNTIDTDRTESPLPDLVIEETLTKNKEDGDLSTNIVDKFKKLCRNPERYINESNTTQILLSDHERMINSPQPDDLTDEIPLIEISSRSFIRLESKSDESIATVGITGHGDSGEAPPSPKLIMEPFAHRNLETEYLDTSTKDYFEKLIYEVNVLSQSNSNVDKLSHTSLSDDEKYMNKRKTISKTRTEVLSNQSSIEKEESVIKVIPKKKVILDLNKNNKQENFADSSESKSVQDKISTSTNILHSRNLTRIMADDIVEPKRKKVLEDFNSGSGITVSSVDDWFKRNEPSSSRAGASDNLLKEIIQNVIEKLETTLTEINQNTSIKFINLFMKAYLKLRDMELECENMYKREASNLFSEMIRTIDEKMIELNIRSQEQHLMFKKFLKEEFSSVITEDYKKKLIMVQLLKEHIQSIIEHAENSTE